MSIYKEIAEEVGQIVTDKIAAYGSSFAKAGEFLKLLYPHGLSVDEFEDALLLVRIFDKLMRVATDGDAFGESPFLDIAGYGVLGVSLHHARKEATAAPAIPHNPALRQEVTVWMSRNAEGHCGVCQGYLNGVLPSFVGRYAYEGLDCTIIFCSMLCADAGASTFTELDGTAR